MSSKPNGMTIRKGTKWYRFTYRNERFQKCFIERTVCKKHTQGMQSTTGGAQSHLLQLFYQSNYLLELPRDQEIQFSVILNQKFLTLAAYKQLKVKRNIDSKGAINHNAVLQDVVLMMLVTVSSVHCLPWLMLSCRSIHPSAASVKQFLTTFLQQQRPGALMHKEENLQTQHLYVHARYCHQFGMGKQPMDLCIGYMQCR